MGSSENYQKITSFILSQVVHLLSSLGDFPIFVLLLACFCQYFYETSQLLFILNFFIVLQLLLNRKQSMYCDYQVYAPVMAPQIMPRPSLFNSAYLFQVFSIALDRNLNDYLKKKNLKHAQNEQKYLSVPTKVKSSEAVVIDLQSEQEMIDQVPPQEKDCHSNTLKLSSANETLSDTIQKEELVGPEEIDSISHTPAKSSVESEVMEEKALSLLCQQKWRCENDFPLFSVECPKLGISNAQLLKKRQKLLKRNVKDWNEVDCKGPKQRRQIRMLKN